MPLKELITNKQQGREQSEKRAERAWWNYQKQRGDEGQQPSDHLFPFVSTASAKGL
ncbi:MAG: hypothetical protein ACO1QR_06575 [Chthoniobacteraceae bacterium]